MNTEKCRYFTEFKKRGVTFDNLNPDICFYEFMIAVAKGMQGQGTFEQDNDQAYALKMLLTVGRCNVCDPAQQSGKLSD